MDGIFRIEVMINYIIQSVWLMWKKKIDMSQIMSHAAFGLQIDKKEERRNNFTSFQF